MKAKNVGQLIAALKEEHKKAPVWLVVKAHGICLRLPLSSVQWDVGPTAGGVVYLHGECDGPKEPQERS